MQKGSGGKDINNFKKTGAKTGRGYIGREEKLVFFFFFVIFTFSKITWNTCARMGTNGGQK